MAEPHPELQRPSWHETALRFSAALLSAALLVYLSWVLFDVMRSSLGWSVSHDTPLLLYMGYLMEAHGFIPYRDFFDMNLLGSYLSYQMIGRFFGFDDPGVRLADVVVLSAIMACTAAMLWRLGWRALWAAPLLFGLFYLREGIGTTLQREFLGLLPIALGTACATALPFLAPSWRCWLAGAAFGIAATVKPHLVIGMPLIVFYLVSEQTDRHAPLKEKLIAMFWLGIMGALGMALPLLAFAGYLVYHGVFGDFVDAAFGYLPLYTQMTGDHRFLTDGQRAPYLVDEFLDFNKRWPMLVIGYVGIAAGLGNRAHNPGQRRVMALVAGLAAAYTIYPVFSGQFWYYHYLPMLYFASVGGAFVLGPFDRDAPWAQRLVPAFIVFAAAFGLLAPHSGWHGANPYVHWSQPSTWYITKLIQQPRTGFAPLYRHERHRPKGGVVEEIETYLKQRIEPGDTVQPLDWAGGGVVHAMLRAEVKIATPFIYYFHFFHHPDTEYIQNLRKKFLRELAEAKPRFIIRGLAGRDFIKGSYLATKRFDEADAFIGEHYEKLFQRRNYIVYERKDAIAEEEPQDERGQPDTTKPGKQGWGVDAGTRGRLVPDLPKHHRGRPAGDAARNR